MQHLGSVHPWSLKLVGLAMAAAFATSCSEDDAFDPERLQLGMSRADVFDLYGDDPDYHRTGGIFQQNRTVPDHVFEPEFQRVMQAWVRYNELVPSNLVPTESIGYGRWRQDDRPAGEDFGYLLQVFLANGQVVDWTSKTPNPDDEVRWVGKEE